MDKITGQKGGLVFKEDSKGKGYVDVDSSVFEEECEKCNGTGYIEIMGDGENFEWDVVDTKPCGNCTLNDEND